MKLFNKNPKKKYMGPPCNFTTSLAHYPKCLIKHPVPSFVFSSIYVLTSNWILNYWSNYLFSLIIKFWLEIPINNYCLLLKLDWHFKRIYICFCSFSSIFSQVKRTNLQKCFEYLKDWVLWPCLNNR